MKIVLVLSGCSRREERTAVNKAPQPQPGAKTETGDQGLLISFFEDF